MRSLTSWLWPWWRLEEIAVAVGAEKLSYLTDVAGILDRGELVSEVTASELRDRIAQRKVSGGMVAKARSALSAIQRAVGSIHIIHGRTPHSLMAELFTARGVGTLVTRGCEGPEEQWAKRVRQGQSAPGALRWIGYPAARPDLDGGAHARGTRGG